MNKNQTVVAYILSSVGYACGWFGHKHKAKGLGKSTTPGPVYEDLQPPTSMQGDPQEKDSRLDCVSPHPVLPSGDALEVTKVSNKYVSETRVVQAKQPYDYV